MHPIQRTATEAIARETALIGMPNSAFSKILSNLNLLDMNHVLFKCSQEEEEDGRGLYILDGYGPLKYAGLQGVMSILSEIRPKNDLGNWLPDNLRKGACPPVPRFLFGINIESPFKVTGCSTTSSFA
jgi:hypothetical protein